MGAAVAKIQTTKNYRLFSRSDENRPTDLRKHKKLERSLRKYGFLRSFPIVCHRNKAGSLIVKDGQHRLAIAESLGLAVHWVEEAVDFDIAEINCSPIGWTVRDYAQKHMSNGKADYEEGLDFAAEFGLPIGNAFALLAGTTNYGNIREVFQSGDFRVKDRDWARAVAGIYAPLCAMSHGVHNVRFLEACMGVCRVEEFDAKRLLHSAGRCREKLVSYSTKEAYLDMLESIYNFHRSRLFGLKAAAVMAMRERNPATAEKKRNGKSVKQSAA